MNIRDEQYQQVIKVLLRHTSMPFLELASVSPVDRQELEKIVSDLEEKQFIRVSNKGNVLDEIVTVKGSRYEGLVDLARLAS